MTISSISNDVINTVDLGNGTYGDNLTINNTGEVTTSFQNAIYGDNSGNFTITNLGIISTQGFPFEGIYGIETKSATTLANSGTITGSFDGVYLVAGGTIINTGTIIGSGNNAIYAKSSSYLNNNGLVDGSNVGFDFVSASSFINQSAGTITGNYAIYAQETLEGTNNGILSATSVGVDLRHGGSLLNSGTVSGGTNAIYNYSDAFTLGAGTGAVFDGSVVDHAGGGVLSLEGATPGSLNIGTSFSGFASIAFGPATWFLEGDFGDFASTVDISGFTSADTLSLSDFSTIGDSLILTDFAATSHTLGGTTLILSDGSTTETITLTTPLPSGDTFAVTTSGGETTISVALESALCYLTGTSILTPSGETPIETLAIGDEVITRFGGTQKIKWLGRQSYAQHFLANNQEKWPVHITPGALDGTCPKRDLYISPGHSMLIGDQLILAKNLINGLTIRQEKPAHTIDYIQIELDCHDCIQAEGTWSETFADAPGLRRQFHNQAEFWALYPAYQTPATLHLCAPRPQAGPELEAALLPITARAAIGVTPGPLEGYIDILTPTRIAGWARDTANPLLPVQLDIIAAGQRIGTLLACDPREDLANLGKGNAAFAVTLTTPLTQQEMQTLTIQRRTDGAQLSPAKPLQKAA